MGLLRGNCPRVAQGGPPHQSQWKGDSWRGQAVLIQWDLAFGCQIVWA